MKQFTSFIRKEFYHILRDWRTMMILLVMPVVLIILFGYAITNEIKNAPIAIFDPSRDEVTTKLSERLLANEYFILYQMAESYEEIEDLFRKNKIEMAIIYTPLFASTYEPSVQLLVDASDPNQATSLVQYATSILGTSMQEQNISVQQVNSPGIISQVNLLYNPQMKAAYNFVPGVMGLILMLICAMMTSVGIVKEKEIGTMEVLLVSPLKPVYIILAKATPYLVLSMINITTILFLSYFLLKVPMAGSIFLLFFVSALYSLVSLSLGLLISTAADSQQAAMLISAMGLMLPVMLLSDMIFPIDNMPAFLQWISHIVPARWYISAIRDIMIKGLGIAFVWKDIAILVGMTIVLITISLKRFKIRLE